MSIPPKLLKQARETLIDCGHFSSNQQVRQLFIDQRISHWRDEIPEAGTVIDRVNAFIDMMWRKYDKGGNNGLVLFLLVLSDNVHPTDACYQRIIYLGERLEQSAVFSTNTTTSERSSKKIQYQSLPTRKGHSSSSIIIVAKKLIILLCKSYQTKNARLENKCGDCDYTWTPKGHDVSKNCPRCKSQDVDINWSKITFECILPVIVISLIVVFFLGQFVFAH